MSAPCAWHTLISDIVVLEDSAVLLVQDAAGGSGWRLPGGALRHGEHPEAAARRLLREQVGVSPENVDLVEVESVPGDNWHLYFHFRTDLDRRPQPGPAIGGLRLFQLEHLPETMHGPWEREVIYRVVGR
jgi:ADP-ribose pyrophosphatase YjhB (NUDIX family)